MLKRKKTTDPENLETSHGNHDNLRKFVRPQWGWRTFISITLFVAVYTFIYIDLEIDLKELLSNGSKYILDVVGRMLPPDFSNFRSLAESMLETVEIAMLGTLLAIILSVPMALLSARNITPNYPVYLVSRTITIFFGRCPNLLLP